jgi:hypothetical protein
MKCSRENLVRSIRPRKEPVRNRIPPEHTRVLTVYHLIHDLLPCRDRRPIKKPIQRIRIINRILNCSLRLALLASMPLTQRMSRLCVILTPPMRCQIRNTLACFLNSSFLNPCLMNPLVLSTPLTFAVNAPVTPEKVVLECDTVRHFDVGGDFVLPGKNQFVFRICFRKRIYE